MSRHIRWAWGGHSPIVPSPQEISSQSYPIPAWKATDNQRFSHPISVWGHPTVSRSVSISKLQQFCGVQPSQLNSNSLQELLTLTVYPPHFRFLLQLVIFVSASVTLCFSTPNAANSPLSSASRFSRLAQQSSNLPVLSDVRPNISITTSLLGRESIANAQIPVSNAYSKPTIPRFINPVEGFPLTSGFGNRIHPISGDLRFHHGVDFGTPTGTPIKAVKQGVVAFAGWNGGYGKTVIVQHKDDYETLYAHLDELFVTAGDRVAQGKVIGLSGGTGYATGPHLHFEIRSNQVARNPLDYLPSFTAEQPMRNSLQARGDSR